MVSGFELKQQTCTIFSTITPQDFGILEIVIDWCIFVPQSMRITYRWKPEFKSELNIIYILMKKEYFCARIQHIRLPNNHNNKLKTQEFLLNQSIYFCFNLLFLCCCNLCNTHKSFVCICIFNSTTKLHQFNFY